MERVNINSTSQIVETESAMERQRAARVHNIKSVEPRSSLTIIRCGHQRLDTTHARMTEEPLPPSVDHAKFRGNEDKQKRQYLNKKINEAKDPVHRGN